MPTRFAKEPTLRLGLNADFDRILELANEHNTLRQMLGHGAWGDDTRYNLQTLKDNLRLFTPSCSIGLTTKWCPQAIS